MSALKRIAVVMDPPEGIQAAKDSSVALMLSAQARGAEIFITTPDCLLANASGVSASMRRVEVEDQKHWWRECAQETMTLSDFDAVLMRKDPPVDMAYIATTWLLDRVHEAGTPVLNAPRALRDINEKFSIASYADLAPPYQVCAQTSHVRQFLEQHGEIVIKPLDRMGGSLVYHLRKENTDWINIVENITQRGHTPIMAQRFLPEVEHGDRRLILIDGKLVPVAAVRIPKAGEFRANMALGARLEVEPVTARDREIAERVGPDMRAAGVYFAGLDVVGGFLTEINITSPTCIRELEAAGHAVSELFWDAVEERLLP